MILGMSIETFTRLHVGLSLVGLIAGLIVLFSLIGRRSLPAVTALFLATTLLTSATGFLFPGKFDPARAVGILSLIVLAIAVYALYGRRLTGAWRPTYVITATLALWLNVFVAITQAFTKIPALVILAPTLSEPPFKAAQGGIVLLFLILGWMAFRNFRAPPPRAATEAGSEPPPEPPPEPPGAG